MDTTTLARLRDVFMGLTLAQRHNLKAVVEAKPQQLSTPVCESLIDLGLVRRDGDALIATEDGRYVASLL